MTNRAKDWLAQTQRDKGPSNSIRPKYPGSPWTAGNSMTMQRARRLLPHVPTIERRCNALMLKDFHVVLPEPGNGDLALWSRAIQHSMIRSVPCERGLAGV